MKKTRIIALFLCVSFILTALPFSVFANRKPAGIGSISIPYSYRVILNSAIFSSSLAPVAMLQLCDTNGELYEVALAENVTINGDSYACSTREEIRTVLSAIPLNSFAKVYVANDNITSIYFDDTPESYTDVTYDTETKQFNNVEVNPSSLPVYYGDFESLTAPYLDSNHKYNIDIYDYGVHITKMTAVNADHTVERMDVNFTMNNNFLQNIYVCCETTDENAMIKAGLYTSDGRLFRESFAPAMEEVAFIDIPNNLNDYIIKLYMTDQDENPVSHVYTKEFSTSPKEIYYLTAINKTVEKDTWGDTKALFLFADSSGTEYTVYCAEKCIVDGVRYSNAEDIIANISLNTFYKLFENENGEITVINQYKRIYGEFANAVLEDDTLSGTVNFSQVTEDFDLIIALYDGDVLADVLSYSQPADAVSQAFEFTVDPNKEYNLKAFFLDRETMTPLGDAAYN